MVLAGFKMSCRSYFSFSYAGILYTHIKAFYRFVFEIRLVRPLFLDYPLVKLFSMLLLFGIPDSLFSYHTFLTVSVAKTVVILV